MRDTSVEDVLSGLTSRPKSEGMRHAIRPLHSEPLDDGPNSPAPESPAADQVFAIKRPVKTIAEAPITKIDLLPEPDALPAVKTEPKRQADPITEVDAEVTFDHDEAFDVPVSPTAPSPEAEPDLPRWHQLSKMRTTARMGKGPTLPVVDADRESNSVRAFDLLRTRLRQTMQEHGWTNIAITAPTSGAGTTFTAVNLALSLSRVSGSRTILMDFNLRNPGVASALDMRPRGSMSAFLNGDATIKDHILRISDTLALGLNKSVDDSASETLQATKCGHTLERMRAALQPELVIYDMPAMLAHDDVAAFLPHLDGVLLVSDGTKTMGRELMECERRFEGQVPLLGVVLNRARRNSIKRYG